MRATPFVVLTALTVSACAPEHDKQVLQLPGSLEGLPFSSAVRADDLLFLSGQVGVAPNTSDLVAGGITAETRQALQNIERVLEFVGSSLDDVVKCTVFLADIAEYGAMNDVYASVFSNDPPARSTLAASGLALNARVEIECIALLRE
jgi:reactive intermediate/imine deaminase